jgi:putative transposase
MVGGVGSLSEYRRFAGAVHSIGWHIVWCPKYRKRVLVGPVADRLRELLSAKAAGRGWSVEALELMPDHVHLLVRTPPDVSAARVAHQMKGFTSNVLRSELRHLRNVPTLWSKPYFVASVGRVSEATIRKYIGEQTIGPIRGKP